MVTIAIVEDNPCDSATLSGYLERAVADGELAVGGALLRADDLRVLVYPDGRTFLDTRPERVDIALLDIEMPTPNGIETARQVRASGSDMVIVFVTNLFQFALEGYEVQALDFLVKPVRYQGFVATVRKALKVLDRRAPHFIKLEFGRAQSVVDIATITYVETLRKRLVVHTRSGQSGGQHNCACSMKAIADKLGPFGFAMPHQSYLVNLAFVERIDATDLLVAGERVPVSRYKRASFVETFAAYAGRVL